MADEFSPSLMTITQVWIFCHAS